MVKIGDWNMHNIMLNAYKCNAATPTDTSFQKRIICTKGMKSKYEKEKKVSTWSEVSVCFFSTKGLPARAGTMKPWKTTSTATIAIVSALPWPAHLRDAIETKEKLGVSWIEEPKQVMSTMWKRWASFIPILVTEPRQLIHYGIGQGNVQKNIAPSDQPAKGRLWFDWLVETVSGLSDALRLESTSNDDMEDTAAIMNIHLLYYPLGPFWIQ